jgi:hypothetical protein
MYAECEKYFCTDGETSRFQFYASLNNATGIIINGAPRTTGTCELPVIFTHQNMRKFYGSTAHYYADDSSLMLWEILYHIHTWTMFCFAFGMMFLVIFRCKRFFGHGYSNVIIVGPGESLATAPERNVTHSYDEVNNDSEELCAICLTQMDVGETVAKLPCGHRYKSACISAWLSNENRCPLCNAQTT